MTTLSSKRKGASLVPLHPYVRLFQAVIHRAVQDLAQNEHRDEARAWLLCCESDYAFATAGICPDSIRQQMS
jgi:hypothetical protein